MRIARWIDGGAVAEGFVIDSRVVPFPGGRTVAGVLSDGLSAAHELRERADGEDGAALGDVRLIAPLAPAAIRDFSAYEEHVEGIGGGGAGREDALAVWRALPVFYFTNPHLVLGPGDAVRPPETEQLDFELEVAAVIGGVPGSDGANLDLQAAEAAIFGYTIMNDWSARDIQVREMASRLGPAKGKDFGTALGPWIVTADELEPSLDEEGMLALHAEVFVNDVRVGEDLVSHMAWTFPELIVQAARNSVVVPGDVIGAGTVGNGGCLGELWGRSGERTPPPLVEGDVVRMVVESIGELTGTVGAAVAGHHVGAGRRRKLPAARTARQ